MRFQFLLILFVLFTNITLAFEAFAQKRIDSLMFERQVHEERAISYLCNFITEVTIEEMDTNLVRGTYIINSRCDQEDNSPLHLAVKANAQLDVLVQLVEKGAQLSSQNIHEERPIDLLSPNHLDYERATELLSPSPPSAHIPSNDSRRSSPCNNLKINRQGFLVCVM